MADFIMPNLGADMAAGTLVKWHVTPGDAVKHGQVIAEVDTEKGIIDIECFETGTISRLVIEPGAKIPVGALMAVIETASAPATPSAGLPSAASGDQAQESKPHASPLARKIAAELGVDLSKLTGTGPGGLIDREDVESAAAAAKAPPPARPASASPRMSPLARRRAAELGLDPAAIQGSGPGGAIEQADIERAAAARASTAGAPAASACSTGGSVASASSTGLQGQDALATRDASATTSGMRRAIAAAMSKSKREIPHYYLQSRVDMSAALKWLEAENAKRSIKDRLLPAVVLLRAVAKALRDVPQLNGFWLDGQHRVSKAIHLGFAISMKGGGLVAPAVHDVDRKSCDDLMADLRDLIPRARAGRLRSSEMTDATLTVTSLGDLGVEAVFGVIYPPQVALVGFGKIMEQPWAKDGMLGVHPVMHASLAADHRATDGHVGAQFLDALNRHLQSPELP